MLVTLSVPRGDGAQDQIDMSDGAILFVLGANGTGKSSLVQRFYTQARPNARRISAHRQTWFTSNSMDLTPAAKRQTEENMLSRDAQEQARYKDDYAAQRASVTIFELIDAQNIRARKIATAVDAADLEAAVAQAAQEAPLAAINSLLRQSNIPIEIDVQSNEQVVARKNGGPFYSVAELSDGERNALLIAGDVLTAKPGTLLIIDEPERHLHRSIISPLLTLLFEKRRDCAFVIATHDLLLPLDNPEARVLLVRSSIYQGHSVSSWDVDLIEATDDISEDVRQDIIGSRRKILFVEGTESSLDKPLYSLIFPMVSVVAKESCRSVEQAVIGLKTTEKLNWVEPYGVIDGDGQSAESKTKLTENGIFPLLFYSVESVYYHPEIIKKASERIAEVTKQDGSLNFQTAIEAGLAKVASSVDRLALKLATRVARERLFDALPTPQTMMTEGRIEVQVDVAQLLEGKKAELQRALDESDWEYLVGVVPIRETGALQAVSKAVGFKGRRDYEAAVRGLLVDDEDTLNLIPVYPLDACVSGECG